MNKKEQYNILLELLKQFKDIFNNWEIEKNEEKANFEYERLARIYLDIIDILINANIIEKYGIKKYKIIENGELI